MKKLLGYIAAGVLLAGCGTAEVGKVSGEKIRDDIRNGLGNEIAIQEPVSKELSLEEAVARALKYNIKQRLSSLNEALSQQQVKVSEAAMLPKVVASLDYRRRDKYDLSDSRNVTTGVVSPGQTVSSSKNVRDSSLTVSWNILDFGLSYVRAKQSRDRALIAAERRRKVTHELVSEVQASYWRAYAAQELSDRVKRVGIRVNDTKKDLEAVLAGKLNKPVDVLRDLREILTLELQLKSISRELVENKTRLASLMGMMPNARYDLRPADDSLPTITVNYKKLEDYALQHRSELREDEYNERISRDEVTAAMLGMLPGINLTGALNVTNDPLTRNDEWKNGSLSIGWNLLNLVTGPQQIELARIQEDIVKARKLVVGSAVLMSVRLAWLDYWESLKNYRAVSALQDVENQLIKKVRAQANTNAISEIDLIRADISNLVNELRYSFAFADVRNAQNRILISIAYDAYSNIDETTDIQELTEDVAGMLSTWQDRVNNLNEVMASQDLKITPVLPRQS